GGIAAYLNGNTLDSASHVSTSFPLKSIHIILACQLIMWLIIPLKLRVHIQHGTDRQQIQLADMDSQLYTPKQ
ncbi:MAG: hypothetical protein IJV20_10840, partial [Prevotella sp.]|nr:hypothetical protein [Prevotella sp.]